MNPEPHYLKKELYDLVRNDPSIFEFLQSGSLDGIWYWDLENQENEWMSPRFWSTLGYDAKGKRHLSSEWQDLIHPEDLKVAVENFTAHCADPHHPYDQVVRYLHMDGSTVWVRCRGMAIRDKTGKPVRMLGAHTDLTQQKQAEEALRESEEKYRRLFHHSNDAIFIHNLEGNIVDANQKALALFGYTESEISSVNVISLHPAEALEKSKRALETILRDGFVNFEIEFNGKNGAVLLAEVSSSLLKIGGRWVVQDIVRDITERKKAEARSLKLNRLNQELLKSGKLNDKLKWITDGVVEIFNADFARIWIINPGDLCDSGCRHADVKEGPHVCGRKDRCLHLLASSGRYAHIDGRHRRVPFGSYKIGKVAAGLEAKFLTNDVVNDPRIHDREWAKELGLMAFAGYGLLSGEGEVVGVLALFSHKMISPEEDALLENLSGTTAQIIQTARAEVALQKSEEKFKLLAEHSADIIYKINLENEQYTYASPSVKGIFGYTEEEILSLKVRDTLTAESYSKQLEILGQSLAQGKGEPEIMELEALHKDGRVVPVETHVAFISDDQGLPTEILGVARDITERKKAEQALADSEKRLSDIIEFLPDPTWVIDVEGRVIAWNRAMEMTTGILKQEMLGKGGYAYAVPFYGKPRPVLIDLVFKRDEKWEKEYLSLREDDGLLIQSESFHPSMGDGGRYFSGTAGRLYNAQGHVVGAIETIRDITATKQTARERERLIEELKDALAQVRTLSGMLPICSSCKKIRDDKGYWNQIESYIRDHSEAEFSHSICPECVKKLYPDLDISKL